MSLYNITAVQLFDYASHRQISEEGEFVVDYSYSANLIINDTFVVQVSGNHSEATFDGITDSDICHWINKEDQDAALESINNKELEAVLEEDGFENNIGWLSDNATDVLNPENAPYRFDNADTNS